jgi:subtilase family serine protease
MKIPLIGSAALLLCASLLTPAFAQSPSANLADWTASVPIRIQPYATNTPQGYSPKQIKNAYGFNAVSNKGAGKIIAIVDAYDNPHAAENLQKFSSQFSLSQMNGTPGMPSCTIAKGPHPCFQKTYANSKPNPNAGWAVESDLDVQWSHAMADRADILLVEAKNSSLQNLLSAIDKCVNMGATVISMSWGGPEFSSEMNYQKHFLHSNVVFVASSGDSGNGVSFPAALPNVVAIGGTTLFLDSDGIRTAPEQAWSESGGGVSAFVSAPSYQQLLLHLSPKDKRRVPDASLNSDPATGYSIYTYTNKKAGWISVGGTSAAAPQWAALFTLGGLTKPHQAVPIHAWLYNAAVGTQYPHNYLDITSGSNGACGTVCTAHIGYDTVTGLGTPHVKSLVSSLL